MAVAAATGCCYAEQLSSQFLLLISPHLGGSYDHALHSTCSLDIRGRYDGGRHGGLSLTDGRRSDGRRRVHLAVDWFARRFIWRIGRDELRPHQRIEDEPSL